MNIRLFSLFAVILLLAVNTVLVLSDICPTGAEYPGVPEWITCPSPENYDCDTGNTIWEKEEGGIWLIWSDSLKDPYNQSSFANDYYRLSREGEYYITWNNVIERSFKADLIRESGAVCGGRAYEPYEGNFRPKRSANENHWVTYGPKGNCYQCRDCDWKYVEMIDGYHPNIIIDYTSMYYAFTHVTVTNACCYSDPSSPNLPQYTVVPCYKSDDDI